MIIYYFLGKLSLKEKGFKNCKKKYVKVMVLFKVVYCWDVGSKVDI